MKRTIVTKIAKPSLERVREIVSMNLPGVTDRLRDSMAIPSFLHWNPLIRWIVWQRYETIAEFADFRNDDTVLEFGCGAGLFFPEIMRHGCSLTGIDLYPEFARALSKRMGLEVKLDVSLDGIKDGSISKVIAAEVFEHLDNPDDYLEDIVRILKPGGELFISLPTENVFYKTGKILAGFHGKEDYHVTDLEDVLKKAGSHGFAMENSRLLPSSLLPLYRVVHYRMPYETE